MSISQAKIDANRRNAQRSTGPRTDEGKAVAAMNAVKHGACAKTVAVRGEEAGEFEQMLAQFLEEHDPQSGTEFALVYRIAMATWNLRRLTEAETEFINQHTQIYHRSVPRLNAPPDPPPTLRPIGESMLSVVGKDSKFGLLQIYQSRLERTFYRALTELRRIKKDRTAQPQAAGEVEPVDEVEVEQTNPPETEDGFTTETRRHGEEEVVALNDRTSGVAEEASASSESESECEPQSKSNSDSDLHSSVSPCLRGEASDQATEVEQTNPPASDSVRPATQNAENPEDTEAGETEQVREVCTM